MHGLFFCLSTGLLHFSHTTHTLTTVVAGAWLFFSNDDVLGVLLIDVAFLLREHACGVVCMALRVPSAFASSVRSLVKACMCASFRHVSSCDQQVPGLTCPLVVSGLALTA